MNLGSTPCPKMHFVNDASLHGSLEVCGNVAVMHRMDSRGDFGGPRAGQRDLILALGRRLGTWGPRGFICSVGRRSGGVGGLGVWEVFGVCGSSGALRKPSGSIGLVLLLILGQKSARTASPNPILETFSVQAESV